MENLQIESFESGITRIFFSSQDELRKSFRRILSKLTPRQMEMLQHGEIYHGRSGKCMEFYTTDFEEFIQPIL